jgi:hypothetical protein
VRDGTYLGGDGGEPGGYTTIDAAKSSLPSGEG